MCVMYMYVHIHIHIHMYGCHVCVCVCVCVWKHQTFNMVASDVEFIHILIAGSLRFFRTKKSKDDRTNAIFLILPQVLPNRIVVISVISQQCDHLWIFLS